MLHRAAAPFGASTRSALPAPQKKGGLDGPSGDPLIVHLEQVRILWLLALRAAGRVPGGVVRAAERRVRLGRKIVPGPEVEVRRAAATDAGLVQVASGVRVGEAPLLLLDVGLDADLLPVLRHHLNHLGPGAVISDPGRADTPRRRSRASRAGAPHPTRADRVSAGCPDGDDDRRGSGPSGAR